MNSPPDNGTCVLRILLAEDNEEDVFIFKEAFADSPYRCDIQVVRDGAQAVACLRREPPYAEALRPDIVVLDINMPVKNGLDALRDIRSDRAISALPVIIFTTSASADDVMLAYRYGASSYIVKPTNYESMQEIVASICMYWGNVVRLPQRDIAP